MGTRQLDSTVTAFTIVNGTIDACICKRSRWSSRGRYCKPISAASQQPTAARKELDNLDREMMRE